ncbi:class I SAM-dependent methyltransferase [Haloglomus litoreum]|uniref:class I SAM-dependent methyltransferase n=1 Tax=Haloglomus litoreum TaxID=3034026 RepID=UPI0023E7C4AA|nr:class I SAM-dependent methyltransferase [Haloglomus sp. DT116]
MVDKEAVRRSYDELGASYGAQRDSGGVRALDALLDSADPDRVLDAGCGPGTPVLGRLDEATAAVGLDVSRAQLEIAAGDVPGAALAQGDMTRLPFAADSFDAVVAYWSLIHVPLVEHPAVLAEFARVLRPGGRALVCEGREAWTGENPDWLDSGVGMAWEMAGAEATREDLRTVGFSVEREWGAADSLDEDDEAEPWVFIEARLER